MTGNPWPSIAITGAVIALFGYLAVWGQHFAERRRQRNDEGEK